MITATKARANKTQFEIHLYNEVKIITEGIIETISAGIEFHSKNGFESAEFLPYDKSQFHTLQEMKIASEIFERTLERNDFKIIKNDYMHNILKVQW